MRTAVLAAYLANEQIRRRAAALAAGPTPEPEEPEEPGNGDPVPVTAMTYIGVGHSLLDAVIDQSTSNPLKAILHEGSTVDAQSIPGSPLATNWEAAGEGTPLFNARDYIAANAVDHLILTENNTIEPSWTIPAIQTWRDQALLGNPDVKTYWYQVWPNIPDNDWQAWATLMLDTWATKYPIRLQQLAQQAGVRIPMIPGGEALAMLAMAIDAGDIPGMTDPMELFSDDVHLTPVGGYFMALVHFATIHRQTPVGRPYDFVSGLSTSTAAALQGLAWTVVSTHPYAGVAAWPTIPSPVTYEVIETTKGDIWPAESFTGALDVGTLEPGTHIYALVVAGAELKVTGGTLGSAPLNLLAENTASVNSTRHTAILQCTAPESGVVAFSVDFASWIGPINVRWIAVTGAGATPVDTLNSDNPGTIDYYLDTEAGGLVIALAHRLGPGEFALADLEEGLVDPTANDTYTMYSGVHETLVDGTFRLTQTLGDGNTTALVAVSLGRA